MKIAFKPLVPNVEGHGFLLGEAEYSVINDAPEGPMIGIKVLTATMEQFVLLSVDEARLLIHELELAIDEIEDGEQAEVEDEEDED